MTMRLNVIARINKNSRKTICLLPERSIPLNVSDKTWSTTPNLEQQYYSS